MKTYIKPEFIIETITVEDILEGSGIFGSDNDKADIGVMDLYWFMKIKKLLLFLLLILLISCRNEENTSKTNPSNIDINSVNSELDNSTSEENSSSSTSSSLNADLWWH